MGRYYFGRKSDEEYYLNLAGRPKPANSFSRYRGVSKNSNSRLPYRAAFKYKGRTYYLGAYATELEAAEAYNKAAVCVIGDFALLNELPQKDPEVKPSSEQTERNLPEV